MTELALDDVQRNALARELERMRVTQLVRREAAPERVGGTRRVPLRLTTVVRGSGRR